MCNYCHRNRHWMEDAHPDHNRSGKGKCFSLAPNGANWNPRHSRNFAGILDDTKTSERRKVPMNIIKKIWQDERGQDLIEYALMAGFVAVAAGAIMPRIAEMINGLFTRNGGNGVDTTMVRIICGLLAVLFLGIIVLRRKLNAEDDK